MATKAKGKASRRQAKPKKSRADIYKGFSDAMLDMLNDPDAKLPPWRRPWVVGAGVAPMNGKTGKNYRGSNTLRLVVESMLKGYSDPRWLTFRQAAEIIGTGDDGKPRHYVPKGTKMTPILFWKRVVKEAKEEGEEDEAFSFAKEYYVLNVEQLGLPADDPAWERLAAVPEPPQAAGAGQHSRAEEIAMGFAHGPKVQHDEKGKSGRAFYRPSADLVNMPAREDFHSTAGYYGTLFHELGHSTGHESRLARKGITEIGMGRESYSFEELIAEMTAGMLSGVAGIEVDTEDELQTAAYLKTWHERLSAEPQWLVKAAYAAQKAADYILSDGGRREIE